MSILSALLDQVPPRAYASPRSIWGTCRHACTSAPMGRRRVSLDRSRISTRTEKYGRVPLSCGSCSGLRTGDTTSVSPRVGGSNTMIPDPLVDKLLLVGLVLVCLRLYVVWPSGRCTEGFDTVDLQDAKAL